MSTPQAASAPDVLLVRIDVRLAALPLRDVVEVSRPLPLHPVAGAPPYVAGVAILRGAPAAVVDLRVLLGHPDPGPATRWVTARLDGRPVALAVDGVVGTRTLDPSVWRDMPALLEGDSVGGLATVDRTLVTLLQASRQVREAAEDAVQRSTAGR